MWSARIVAGAVLVVLGIGWLLQTAGIVHFDSNIIAPIALIGIGVALVAGSPRGMHVPLLIAGIVLTAVLAGDTGMHNRTMHAQPVSGSSAQRPLTAADIHPYSVGAGNLVVDLTALPHNGETYRISGRVGTGRLEVIVPSGMAVSVDARSAVGNLDIFGQHSSGISTNDLVNISYPGRTRFVLHLRAGAGSIQVVHDHA